MKRLIVLLNSRRTIMLFKPVEAEDAATVLLVREARDDIEVYMTQRQDELIFLGGYHVFPGGKVDEQDSSEKALDRCRCLSPEQARARLSGVDAPRQALGFFMAAARELFEEAGVLLAEDSQGNFLDHPSSQLSQRLNPLRQRLQADQVEFCRLLEPEELYLSLSRLLWFAHWITPATSPRRFNTHFFLARCPRGQSASPFTAEVAQDMWVRPLEALERWRAGEWKMIPPTFSSLDTLSNYQSWEALKADFSRPPEEHFRTMVRW